MDILLKGIIEGEDLLLAGLVDTATIERARLLHDTYPTASAALGRVLNGAILLSSSLKDNQKVYMQVSGDGPVGEVFAEADWKSRVRGYIKKPHVHLDLKNGKLDVGGAVGKGFLNVVKDLGLRDPYRGTVDLKTGEIAEDLAYYLNSSEQVPSAVSLGVYVEKDNSVKAAGGFMINTLPGVTDEMLAYLENRLKHVRSVSSMILDGMGPKEILEEASGMKVKVLEERKVEYYCPCSKDRVLDAISTLGRADLEHLLEKGESLEVHCRFCKTDYVIAPQEVRSLIEVERFAEEQAEEGGQDA